MDTTEIDRPARLQHTWMSRKTLGEETVVTVTFQKKGEGTLMTLLHSGFTTDEMPQAHEKAWNFILGNSAEIFGSGANTVTGRSSY
jgi:Activator of Hsp90 ATPase homolog 1-like protein